MRRIALSVAVLGWVACTAATAASFEQEPDLAATDLVAPVMLSGPGYRVEPVVRVRGFQAHFVLRTDFGEIEAQSIDLLSQRIAEIPALEALHRLSPLEVAAHAATDSARAGADALKRIASAPLETAAALPGGVLRFFARRATRLDERGKRLGDRVWRGAASDGDPYDRHPDALFAVAPTESTGPAWHSKPRREMVRLVRGELDQGKARRAIAQRLGIDPDSANPLIAPRLDALAWTAAGTNVGIDLTLGRFGAAAPDWIETGERVHAAAWELDSLDLRARNRARISPWCRDERLLRAFLRHRSFGAALQTEFSERLRALAPRTGCNALLETALMAKSEVEARFVVDALQLVQKHVGAAVAAGGDFFPLGSAVLYRDAAGAVYLPLGVEHLSWTEPLQRFFDGEYLRISPRTLLVSGSISMRSQRELTARGWSLVSGLRTDLDSGWSALRVPTRAESSAALEHGRGGFGEVEGNHLDSTLDVSPGRIAGAR